MVDPLDQMHPLPGMAASPILTSAHKIAIAGLGLIGGSLARRLVQRGRFVVAWNHTDKPYEAAQAAGIHTVDSLEELALGKPDVLVLATPLKAMPDMLSRLAPVLPKVTTLTDVGSVKGQVRAQATQAGLAGQYVGAHPMTGSEFSGYAASDPDLFEDALWALCVDEQTDMSRFLTVADMVTQGVGDRFICLDDATHDRSAALISHMPHVVATALAGMLSASPERQVAAALAAGSWRDMTRVALTDPQRTEAMVLEDAANVASDLRQLSSTLSQVAGHLEEVSLVNSTAQASPSAEIPPGKALGQLREFFAAAQPFRNYKAAQQSQVPRQQAAVVNLQLSDEGWRDELKASALQGQQVVRFLTTHQAQVSPALSW
ncbi:prephenate dehydrogenase [Bombiscardovia nodaiensis]|uniref:Prephenate dehydrogenase n=1 Tax=Bombiscardovia nodaiensis TaxID=2932181 RepID=A0ABM8B8M9_9BIFI|nr:prephenate dehydrogenase [Bombiscardovia nodaiensis]